MNSAYLCGSRHEVVAEFPHFLRACFCTLRTFCFELVLFIHQADYLAKPPNTELNRPLHSGRLTECLKRVGSNDKLGFLRNYEFQT